MSGEFEASNNLILLDSTVLSNFALVNSARLVMDLWKTCATSRDAWQEYQKGISVGKLPREAWLGLPIVDLTEAERRFAAQLSSGFGAGERACLAIAHARRGRLVTDDRKARQAAAQMNVPVTGTIGILVRAVERKRLSLKQANRLLAVMIEKGFRSPTKDLSSTIQEIP